MPIACPSLIGSSYPELCAAVDHYCERTSSAFDAEPVNALTNAAFLIGACIAWRIRSGRRGSEGRLVVALTFFDWPPWLKLIVLAMYFAATFYAEASVPASVLWGGALYLPTVLLMLVIGASLYVQQMPGAGAFLTATAVFLISFAARTLDARVCAAFPLGTHFLWHLLNAALLFILIRAAIVYSAPARAARRSRSAAEQLLQ
jgi:hypothetical protein